MSHYLFKNAAVFDPVEKSLLENFNVLIENKKIKEVSDKPILTRSGQTFDLNGKTLMPGLIDAHVHLKATRVNIKELGEIPTSYLTAEAQKIMLSMLMRGFTSVRDAGGSDKGMAAAIEDKLWLGPRLFVSGLALSQTGGHGDLRSVNSTSQVITCACQASLSQLARIADGIDECRRAARDELRKGADQIKIMAGGGVASPSDPIHNTQYSVEEIKAICQEAKAANKYVMAHAYIPGAIIRAVQNGVRTIEHGNLLNLEAAKVMKAHDAFLVPTNVTYRALHKHGKEFGFPKISIDKLKEVLDVGLRSLEIAQSVGVKIGHGSDLLGECHKYQSDEFTIKAEVLGNHETIRQATIVNAEILGKSEKLGIIKPEAIADIIVVDGDPIADISLLQGQGENIPLIMKDGIIYKNRL